MQLRLKITRLILMVHSKTACMRIMKKAPMCTTASMPRGSSSIPSIGWITARSTVRSRSTPRNTRRQQRGSERPQVQPATILPRGLNNPSGWARLAHPAQPVLLHKNTRPRGIFSGAFTIVKKPYALFATEMTRTIQISLNLASAAQKVLYNHIDCKSRLHIS